MLACVSGIKNVALKGRSMVPLEKRNIFFIYFFILLGTTLDNLNNGTMLTLAGDIQERFNTDSSTTSWVLSGYALTLGSFIMVTGKIAGVIGPHNIFLCGLTTIWVCSLVCAVLPQVTIIPLIVFRAIQGIGASSLIPASLSLTANYFSGKRAKFLPTAIGFLLIALTSSFGVGIIIGGAFSLTSIGYRSFFYFSFAVGLLCNIILYFMIIPIEQTEGHKQLDLKNVDYVAALLVISGTLLMILGLTEGGEGWVSAKAIVPLIIGFLVVLAALFFEGIYLKRFRKKHTLQDRNTDWRLSVEFLFPPEILHIPNIMVFLTVTGLQYATEIMFIASGVQYFMFVEHNSPILASVKIFPVCAGIIFGALTYRPWMYEKLNGNKLFVISAILSLVGVIWFSRLDYTVANSYWRYCIFSAFIYGYGINIFFNIYMNVVIESTPLHLQGVVNGILQTTSQVLLSIGNALVPSITGNVSYATTEEMKQYLQDKYRVIFYIMMGFQGVVLLLMIFCIQNNPSKRESEEDLQSVDCLNIEKDEEVFEKVESKGIN